MGFGGPFFFWGVFYAVVLASTLSLAPSDGTTIKSNPGAVADLPVAVLAKGRVDVAVADSAMLAILLGFLIVGFADKVSLAGEDVAFVRVQVKRMELPTVLLQQQH